jgi:hypothetical protein
VHLGERAEHGAQPPDLDAQARPMRLVGVLAPNARATSMSRETSPGQASARARASANSTGRVASETTACRLRTA